ncbi:MAG: DUF4346 domain-containing protein [Geitlerinemataceae cyanobacterium]
MTASSLPTADATELAAIDNKYSNRHINLDPEGYFLIYIDREAGLICAKHFGNTVNEAGFAVDPETGEVLSCDKPLQQEHTKIYTGRTAKELGMEITEKADPRPVSCLDHALYLGREFVRAEIALIEGSEYIQD